MEKASEAIILFLINKRYIGARHFPEERLIASKTRWLNKEEKKEFEEEYKNLLNYLIRVKKRTGKGSGWHISINPKNLKEVYELLE